MTFLEKLDYLKKKEGLNNSTLSQKTGIPYTTIDSFYKKGYRNMKFETLEKLSKFFNVSLDYLMNENITDERSGIDSDDTIGLFKFMQYERDERTMHLEPIEVDIIEAFRRSDSIEKEMVLRVLKIEREDETKSKLS